MASLMRVAARQGCRLLTSNIRQRQPIIQPACLISTSKKNKDSASVSEPLATGPQFEGESKAEEDTYKNWISFGYSLTDRDEDAWAAKMIGFLSITLCICWGGFVIAYMPDHRMKDWVSREAFLELARREKEGLPLIDANYVPVENIELPSDEELGERAVII